MKLCLYLDPTQTRVWMRTLVERLQHDLSAEIGVEAGTASMTPDYITDLLDQERAKDRDGAQIGSDLLEFEVLKAIAPTEATHTGWDCVIDLIGDGNAPAANARVRVLFNGYAGQDALLANILQSGLPQIALQDQDGAIVATAQPSAELAKGVTGSMDQVYARLITLLVAYLGHRDRWVQPLVDRKVGLPSQKELSKRMAKARVKAGLKQIYYKLFRAAHWRIGWRWVNEADVWSRKSLAGEVWQVLRDPENSFYADPVPWEQNGRHYLFFEDLDRDTDKGIISVVEFDDDGQPEPARPCLEEPYHLSYPFLIEHEGETYMIPETSNNGDVALYKAKNFPFGWERHKVILENIDAADVTITQHEGKWWMFCVTRDGAGGYSDCLSIFNADDLFGPWEPHAQNPVLIDTASARPAGNFVKMDGKLLRPVQDCSISYGARLSLVEVTHLSPDHYEQQVVTKLGPNRHWPGRNLHTLNRAGKLEAIDGAIIRPRLPILRMLAERIWKPAA